LLFGVVGFCFRKGCAGKAILSENA
jgi:hypothetical protein